MSWRIRNEEENEEEEEMEEEEQQQNGKSELGKREKLNSGGCHIQNKGAGQSSINYQVKRMDSSTCHKRSLFFFAEKQNFGQ